MERSNSRVPPPFLPPIPGLTPGLPDLCSPWSFHHLFSGQSDQEPTHPEGKNDQGALPGPKTCQASSSQRPSSAATVCPSSMFSSTEEPSTGPGSFHFSLLSASLFAVFLLQTSQGFGDPLVPRVCIALKQPQLQSSLEWTGIL